MTRKQPSQAAGRSKRTRARRNAVQALYQWHMSRQDVAEIEQQFQRQEGFHKADADYFHELLFGVPAEQESLDSQLAAALDRPLSQLDPVELAILRIGTFELERRLEIPWRVVINESIELAKMFGAEESHKYINGILDKVAGTLRAEEVKSSRAQA